MKSGVLAVIASVVLLQSGCSMMMYGPPRDQSKFVSAKLADGKKAVFTFSHLVYRPAKGIAAFPDGGIPKYTRDVNVLGTYDIDTGKLKVLKREKNRDWEHGHGKFFVSQVNGNTALVTQSGQVRGPYSLHTVHWLVDVESGNMTKVPLEEDLAERGRVPGGIYMVDKRGTLMLITLSLEEAKKHTFWRRTSSVVPELWLRRTDGKYDRIAATRHYERVDNGRIIYWMPDTRTFKAYDIEAAKTIAMPNYKHPPYKDVTEGVSVSTHGKLLQYGTKQNGTWKYEDLKLTHSELKR